MFKIRSLKTPAHEAGRQAAIREQPATANPYRRTTAEGAAFYDWQRGWLEGRTERLQTKTKGGQSC